MLKRILIAALASGALALNAPVALADPPTFDCGFDSVQNDTATGPQNYTGVAYGYIVDADSEDDVWISCYIQVNGTPGPSTPADPRPRATTTQGTVQFHAEDDDLVEICAEYHAHGVTDTVCFDSMHQDIPPQEVIDAINSVFDAFAEATEGLDPIICGVLKTAGVPAIINMFTSVTGIYMDSDDCDLWHVTEGRLIDFSPYND